MSIIADSPERQRRIATAWERDRNADLATVTATVDAELAVEAERQADADRYTADLHASLASMFACPICGANAIGRGLCDDCSRVHNVILEERAAAKPVNGANRRAAVEAWMDRRQAVT